MFQLPRARAQFKILYVVNFSYFQEEMMVKEDLIKIGEEKELEKEENQENM